MKITPILVAILFAVGATASVPAAYAKKHHHHKSHSASMKKMGNTVGMKPDASGQGGSGPGSDQGGTKVAPGNMK
jgi:hypothetical protein